ncbi:MAG: 50S ribosomal protein L4 [Candidatus Zambryskibacteria bacterium RIFCSPHIGHO2_01_FULL_43_25]|uniref:Large ribosomal subunit protein uL4 n=1 Tax=Candidatus Zambryskibacteria bacterium RIFCSPLOWO2_01_FULL_45_21 TaxID=1802761 RepID=A0A1G2U4J0_9BACT|nr:MAG: 50S ribosomal protein L4 [Candidatus Zambryskibacteria bacterium RIFCSPHIGHO2_01_FULL_43_25]OHB00821.1 MAG: 50S ribosomal protein L4 [Candidatus Zambryskibacteria bacterium RIFCSPHIGHO2_12_FULL_44_12b]OHB04416.1 MAG: 50S ribosomal protein L4 [Candidatus Zambryskibacteria bacterium RIFCSPLOWO2_01_FULL_45_21]
METTVYNQKGEVAGKTKLPENIFGVPWNADLMHQVVVSMQANARNPIAHTKNRSEVSGGGKKPWKQKGTGRARHGSIRSPIWVGGGVTHGPRNEKIFSRKINKKMKAKALYAALSKKFEGNEVLFIDDWSFNKPKTAEAVVSLRGLSKISGMNTLKAGGHPILLVNPKRDEKFEKSFHNIGNINLLETRNLNPVAVLSNKYIVLLDPKRTIEILSSRFGDSSDKGEVSVEPAKTKLKSIRAKKKTSVKKNK